MEGEMTEQNSIPLTAVQQEGVFTIDSVSDRDPRTLQQFKASGIKPGARLRVRKKASPEGYSVSIGRSSTAFDLSTEAAGGILLLPTAK
jgi:hypothetical protein